MLLGGWLDRLRSIRSSQPGQYWLKLQVDSQAARGDWGAQGLPYRSGKKLEGPISTRQQFDRLGA